MKSPSCPQIMQPDAKEARRRGLAMLGSNRDAKISCQHNIKRNHITNESMMKAPRIPSTTMATTAIVLIFPGDTGSGLAAAVEAATLLVPFSLEVLTERENVRILSSRIPGLQEHLRSETLTTGSFGTPGAPDAHPTGLLGQPYVPDAPARVRLSSLLAKPHQPPEQPLVGGRK
ncbi:unnamed protein product [Orchesella dallaii]|uniref:Uncharacterized protein n=1 Tax=Orchesella dallaii TaxID=48710 RepID=A0ABP1RNX4_9HEXA